MEPVTHFLAGACIARAGLNRKTAYATVVATLAAEAGDMDMLWSLAGPVESLKHHRGITHTLVAAPLVAAVVVAGVWAWNRWIRSHVSKSRHGAPGVGLGAHISLGQPVRWGWLYATALIAALSHLLLDWTNNYGVRPLFPFNPRWYAGSFVFIAEPVLWVLLGGAFVLPWLLGLADQEIGVRRKPFRGRGWAIFALTGMVALWGLRWTEHAQAEAMVATSGVAGAAVERVAVEPYPVNPFRWHAILETPESYQTAEVNSRTGAVESEASEDAFPKPVETAAVRAAKQTELGRVYLDWGKWAVVRDMGQLPVDGMEPPKLLPGRTWTTVKFSDLRFSYSFLGRPGAAERAPLTGWVYIVDGREEAGEAMGGREQR
jgi:inner membrane protein